MVATGRIAAATHIFFVGTFVLVHRRISRVLFNGQRSAHMPRKCVLPRVVDLDPLFVEPTPV